MGNNQYKDYSDEYEEPGYKLEERWFWNYNQPRRLRKNPIVPPCTNYDECKSVEDWYEYKDWVSKEWAVYVQEINLFKEDVSSCLKTDKIKDAGRVCGPLLGHYMNLVSTKNLAEAKKYVKQGNRLVNDSGFVFNYVETEKGFEELLKEYYDKKKLESTEEYKRDYLEKRRRFPYQ